MPQQGLLQGDELLALDGFDLGRNLEGEDPNVAINGILSRPDALLSKKVRVRVRRHHADLAALHESGKVEVEDMLKTVPPFAIFDGLVTRHPEAPALDDLAALPFEIIEVDVPKALTVLCG